MTLRRLLLITLPLGLAACAATPAPEPAPVVVAAPEPAGFVMPEGYRWSHGLAPAAAAAMRETFGIDTLAPNEFVWADTLPDTGEARVIVDLKEQMTYAYKGEVLVGAASVSTGKAGKETQLGFWPILTKHRHYRSRKYDNAPMPYFQRMDRFGIGLHGGHNPGYPASHGCIRLPEGFAAKLFALTAIGDEVVVEG
ncbi:L,D-transpeptidase family protein [Sphingomicrobium astaxanthinifaciens]|uniref:L,D-transpeptidase family protein n=1 Tax=Sphingomicrobium astaxanthinifaciens TaxID=1227949 RepID=UPI001FCC05B1|nr:L,D-transpeptidase family protein [Sphingomicrobium astaxanthinifaciens]MCJ7420856.1 L,D-transpeptidase family protein [Sphingomicrobium astaxanthinifaciens]